MNAGPDYPLAALQERYAKMALSFPEGSSGRLLAQATADMMAEWLSYLRASTSAGRSPRKEALHE